MGLNKGKTWIDVKRELSNEQIVEIHNLYWSLWPIETDILNLLPKPDDTLRVIYTGVLDPRVISYPLALAPYFDEVLIQHPFVHPKAVNKEFSPIDNPHQHKYQTLKNLLLFLYLEPFVRSGFVNFIPDPCAFDNHLHRAMIKMAEERRGNIPINEQEAKFMMKLSKDDLARTIRGMPDSYLETNIKQTSPELSEEDVEEVIQYMRNLNEDDPLALLQDDLYSQGAQLMMSSMAPNLEMSLYIAQATGAAILTDSMTRWEEIKSVQIKDNGNVSYPFSSISDFIGDKIFTFSADSKQLFDNGVTSTYGNIRKLFRELLNKSKQDIDSLDEVFVNRCIDDFQKAFDSIMKVIDAQDEKLYRGKINIIIPRNGFAHNNAQRLLLMSGSQGHLNNVSMSIFIETVNW